MTNLEKIQAAVLELSAKSAVQTEAVQVNTKAVNDLVALVKQPSGDDALAGLAEQIAAAGTLIEANTSHIAANNRTANDALPPVEVPPPVTPA